MTIFDASLRMALILGALYLARDYIPALVFPRLLRVSVAVVVVIAVVLTILNPTLWSIKW